MKCTMENTHEIARVDKCLIINGINSRKMINKFNINRLYIKPIKWLFKIELPTSSSTPNFNQMKNPFRRDSIFRIIIYQPKNMLFKFGHIVNITQKIFLNDTLV